MLHVLLLKKIFNIVENKESIDTFFTDYQVTFPVQKDCGFSASVQPLINQNCLPHLQEWTEMYFFYRDDTNYHIHARNDRTSSEAKFNATERSRRLNNFGEMCRLWKKDDFLNIEKLLFGLEYSDVFWYQVKRISKKYAILKTPQNFQDDIDVIIGYYQSLIDSHQPSYFLK